MKKISIIEHINAHDFIDCQRLFHGRGHGYDNLSHVNVDWLSPVILITLYASVDEIWLLNQAKALQQLTPQCLSVQVQRRYEKFSPTHVLLGDAVDSTIVTENSLAYHIELGKAQNSGLFLDMANGRAWVKQHSQGKNVLNLFAYTCAFSVVAAAGDANQVVNFDVSKSSLSKGRANHQLNKLAKKEGKQIVYEGVDIFKSNSRIKKYGKYDLLICDPPSFQKGSVNIARDYAKIIRKIPQWMNEGAQLLLCLNSPDLDEQFLKEEVVRECPDCVFEQRIANPMVYKETYVGKGLKALVFTYQPQA